MLFFFERIYLHSQPTDPHYLRNKKWRSQKNLPCDFIFPHFKSPKSLNETRVKAANFLKHNSNLKH
jgi:hypothetical protein